MFFLYIQKVKRNFYAVFINKKKSIYDAKSNFLLSVKSV